MAVNTDVVSTLQALRARLKDVDLDATVRQQAYDEARSIMLALESSADTLLRHHWAIMEAVALDLALRMGVLQTLIASPKPMTAQELAQTSRADELLTDRILRCMSAWGSVDCRSTPGGSVYSANHITRTTASDRGKLHLTWMLGTIEAGALELPRKIETNGLKSLTTGINGPFNDLRNKPNATLFQLLTPTEIATFKRFMPTFNLESVDWLQFYPAEERLVSGAKTDPQSALFLDVGGLLGHQAAAFRTRFPEAPGRVILQDLPHNVANVLPSVEGMSHDFFTPQPVKGARAYYFRYIMHDWSDDDNTKILSAIRDAMEPGYSRLLIHDWIMPNSNASTLMTSMDLMMMATTGGQERPLDRHKAYIEAAGLQITGVWDLKDGRSQAIIECERV